jgi:hypothetical protein
MQAGLDRDLDLVPTPSVAATSTGSLKPAALRSNRPAEAADLGVGAGAGGGAHHRLDEIDQAVARIDVDARIGVSEPVFAVDHAQFQSDDGWLRGIPRSCNGSQAPWRIYYVDNNRPSRKGPELLRNQGGDRSAGEATELNIPNIITLGRIILVPIIVWAIVSEPDGDRVRDFVIAGVSDAVDGLLAKRFNMTSELGALLDPLADKALLVSIYVALGIWGAVPRWIVILVVSRDIMIVTA